MINPLKHFRVKDTLIGEEAREAIIDGVVLLEEIVASTLGPEGRTVVIEDKYGLPRSTKDGVSVAEEIYFGCPFKNAGAQMIKQAASRANVAAGDGTTTATVLARHIVEMASEKNTSPVDIRDGINELLPLVMDALKKSAKPISTLEDIYQVAYISTNGDEDSSRKIADIVFQTGLNGVVTVEASNSQATTTEIVEGMQIDSGFMSPYFITNTQKATVELENVFILPFNGHLANIQSLFDIVEQVHKDNASILVVADSVDASVLEFLVTNKLDNNLKICVVLNPDHGSVADEILRDIATVTKGKVVDEGSGVNLATITPDLLGFCSKVKVYHDKTLFIGGKGTQEDIAAISEQALAMSKEDSGLDKELRDLQKLRHARLKGGVGIIRVGGQSTLEVNEKKDRVDDAVAATKAALEMGVVPGGGVALLKVADALKNFKTSLRSGKAQAGIEVLLEAMEQPFKKILRNGDADFDTIKSKILQEGFNYGYNLRERAYTDLVKVGVVDPLKVVITSLDAACSVATVILLTEAVVVNERKED